MTREEKIRFKELKRKYKEGTLTANDEMELLDLCYKEKSAYDGIAKIKFWIMCGIAIQCLISIIIKVLA